jgi:hypothetical protein
MREEFELKSDRISRKKDGENRLISLLLSCFSSSDDDDDFDRSTKDEVLKPLYYIVGDFDSEQMEATVESIDDESIDKKAKPDKKLPRRSDFRRRRFFGGILCGFKKIMEVEIASNRLASSTRINDTKTNERATNRRLDKTEKAFMKPSTSRYGYQVSRILRLPFLCLSTNTKKHDSHSLSTKSAQNDQNSQLEMKVEKTGSDDSSFLRSTALGVTFAHPVYTGKCHLLIDEANADTTNYLWTKLKTGFSVEIDDYTLPPTKTIVETATSESWGSGGSSSLYPTDEQSNEEGNFYYGSFDSDVVPFDEIFTDTIFFEYDQS